VLSLFKVLRCRCVSSYRHQLNHNPKHIYKCDMRNCDRTFVRQDLLHRHKERHSNSDKEYQWQLEKKRREDRQASVDISLQNPRHIISSHAPPVTEIDALASMTSGALDLPIQDIDDTSPATVSQALAENYDTTSSILEPMKTSQIISEFIDQDMRFSYNTEHRQIRTGLEYSDQDENAPHQYDLCELWQDELALSGSMPDFGGQGYNRSPFTMSDDFIRFLFGNGSDSGASLPSSTIVSGGFDESVVFCPGLSTLLVC
jgi:hypothetical protein